MKTINENLQIAIIGMGYVGLPLAIDVNILLFLAVLWFFKKEKQQ